MLIPVQYNFHQKFPLLASLPVCHPTKGPWICGGAPRRAVLGQPVDAADIDYFCATRADLRLLQSRLESYDACVCAPPTPHHTTYQIGGLRIQVVHTRLRESLEEHLAAFDFTLCQIGWDGQSLWMTPACAHALETRTMHLVGTPSDPLATWMRVLKYARQGFTLPPETLQALCAATGGEETTDLYGTDLPSPSAWRQEITTSLRTECTSLFRGYRSDPDYQVRVTRP